MLYVYYFRKKSRSVIPIYLLRAQLEIISRAKLSSHSSTQIDTGPASVGCADGHLSCQGCILARLCNSRLVLNGNHLCYWNLGFCIGLVCVDMSYVTSIS